MSEGLAFAGHERRPLNSLYGPVRSIEGETA